MSDPVNLTNLRTMTDGDAKLEQALFQEFYGSFEKGIAALKANVSNETAEAWRKQAHALKGIAVNLGAEALGTLCKQAQEAYTTAAGEKHALAERISSEYAAVKVFLQKL